VDNVVMTKMYRCVNFFYPQGILKKILEFIIINRNKEMI